MNYDNIDLSTIWKQQKGCPPDIEELLSKLKQYKKSSLRKLIITNILLAATLGFIIYIWHKYQYHFISTKIGICLIIIAIVMFILASKKLIPIFNNIDNTKSNVDYLKSLSLIKVKQKILQNKVSRLYFILLFSGVCLYMYEFSLKMTIGWAIFSYLITFIWIGFNWFYVRPKTIKKEQASLEELIRIYRSINHQLTEKE